MASVTGRPQGHTDVWAACLPGGSQGSSARRPLWPSPPMNTVALRPWCWASRPGSLLFLPARPEARGSHTQRPGAPWVPQLHAWGWSGLACCSESPGV